MKKLFPLLVCALLFSANVFANDVFTLVSSEKKTLKFDDLTKAEAERTLGKKDGTNLVFTATELRLVILSGPEDDMLSYRIQGMRNPTLVVPAGATLKILFVNRDSDMKHDVRFGDAVGVFPASPDIATSPGSSRLGPKADGDTMQGEEMVLKATASGKFKYFCSVIGHAKGGMWGNVAVGVKPDDKMDRPTKPTDDEMKNMPGMRPGETMNMPVKKPDETAEMKGMNHQPHGTRMSSVTNIGDPMERESSGTSWAPDSTPMFAHAKMFKDGGMMMLMGNAFVRYAQIGSDRDVSVAGRGSRSRVDAPSMFMMMYSRPLTENSQIGLRAMFSLDPLLQRGYGYPLLYQSGELFRGEPIHDRQHPHDLFSELAVTYSYKFKNNNSVYIYAGYPGEPALGPPTFVHRESAANDPDAPIGHHWQDATHITWGVVTAGYSYGKVKVEASAFKGEEPNENRWDFDRPKLDSYSARLSWNPTKDLAFQFSRAVLKHPEPAEPETHTLQKTTASAIYNKPFGDDRNWASTFVWGQNYANQETTNSFLFESNFDFYKNAVFGRIERVQKSGHDLVLDPPDEDRIFWLGSYSLGYVRDLVKGKDIDVGLGGMLTFNSNPSTLTAYYGGTVHTGFQMFLRFRASKMKH
ncbi:MAG: sulfocyanin-like copper-binding protein [Acidobacteriota bacterium]